MKKSIKVLLASILAMVSCLCFFACNNSVKNYTVTVNAGSGITVECDKEIAENSDLEFTARLNDGYEGVLKVSATVGGENASVTEKESGKYVISAVKGDVVITVTGAEVRKFDVTVNACEGVSVVCEKKVEKNGSLDFTVSLLRGYEGELKITATVVGKEVTPTSGVGNFLVISGIDGDVVITVTGAKKKALAVTKNAGEGITIVGDDEVAYGGDYIFSVEKPEGSVVAVKAVVDGSDAAVTEENGKYVVKNVTGALTIEAYAEGKESFGIRFSSDNDAVILPADGRAEHGSSYAFEVKLKEGYRVKGEITAKANGEDVPFDKATGKFVIASVTSFQDVVIEADAEEITYTVTVTANVADGIKTKSFTYGYFDATVKFTVELADDYSDSEITVSYSYDGKSFTALDADENGYYEFENAKADVTVRVDGIRARAYSVRFKLFGEVKYEIEVLPYEKISAAQLAAAQEAIVKDTEYTFVSWAEATDEDITADTEINAKVLWGEKIEERVIREEKNAVTATTLTSDVPDTFETVIEYEWEKDSAVNGNAFSFANIAAYKKIAFKLKSNHWVMFNGSSDWGNAKVVSDWANITIEKVTGGEYSVNVVYGEDWSFERTAYGETFAAIMNVTNGSYVSDVAESYKLWITEIRGVEDEKYVPADVEGKNLGCAVKAENNLGKAEAIPAPAGYETVYSAAALKCVGADAAKYTSLRFAVMCNGYILFKPDWSKLADMRGVWMQFEAAREADGYAVTVTNLYSGETLYTEKVTGSYLNEIINYDYSKAGDESTQLLYVTELRGTSDPAFGTIESSVFAGGVKSETEEVPAGFDTVYVYTHECDASSENYVDVPFANISLEGYDRVSFAVKNNHELLFYSWNAYVGPWNVWATITLEKVEGGWKVSCSEKLDGGNVSAWLSEVHTGNTIGEVLNGWVINEKYVNAGAREFYSTNVVTHKA